MESRHVPRRPSRGRLLGAFGGPMLLVILALGGSMAGCSSSDGSPMTGVTGPAAPAGDAGPAAVREAPVPMGAMHMPTAGEVSATWKARPDYVQALPAAWQEAYAFALARPDVLQWLPCYCGCVAMDHRSNLDCFFQHREAGGRIVFEEHASYCDICVEIANTASAMLRDGSTMSQVRASVDATFGATAPGTDTPLPPAS